MRTLATFTTLVFLLATINLNGQQGGYALQFDGTKNVNCGTSASLNITGTAITLEAWVFPTAFSTNSWENVIVNKLANLSHGYNLRCGGDGIVEFYVSNTFANTGYAISDAKSLPLNTWTHLAGTYDGANVKLYINGKLVKSTPWTYAITSTDLPLYIGNHGVPGYPDRPFIGKIDEVRVWNIARTEAEINANIFKEIGTHANLKAYYKMSDGTGTSLTDNSGNNNTGTLTNGPVWKASGCFSGSRQALDFDGSNDYVNMPTSFGTAFSGLQHFSFCGWVYHSTLNTDLWGTYFSRYNSTDGSRVLLHSLPSSNKYGYDDILVSISNPSYGHAYTTTNVLELNKWIHLAFVYDGTQGTNTGKIKIFVNGRPEILDFDGTTFPASISSINQFQYLGRYTNPDYFKGGKFDEFSFWNVSLTEEQIREIMFKTLEGNESGLFAYYRFDQYNQSGGTTLYDMTANGHDGTLTNMDATTDWVASTAFNTWLGGQSNDWSTAGNWSNGAQIDAHSAGIYNWSSALPNVTTYLPVIPATISVNNLLVPSGVSASGNVNLTATGSVFLGSSLTLSSSALNTAKNLLIESGKTLTIPASGQLTVSGLLTNSAGNSGLVIESDGSLIHNSNGVAATLKREITGSPDLTLKKYHFVAIPTQYASPTSNLFLGSYLYQLDPAQINTENNYGKWIGLGTSTTTPLTLNQGYMIYYPDASRTYTFEGNLNNSTYNYALTGHTGSGVYTFNLVPNPFPSAIIWNTGDATKWTKSAGVGGSCYIWNASNGNYSTISSGATSYIPAGQALMVLVANEASPTLSVNNNARAHSTQPFYKSVSEAGNQLAIKATSNNYADETVVKFTTDATEGFDLQTDGLKLFGLEEAPQLYTLSGSGKFSMNNLPVFEGEKIVPMNFEMQYEGQVNFAISGSDSFDPELNIYLRDDLAGQTINLRHQSVYSFNHNPENSANRFKLVFGGTNAIEENASLSGNMWIAGNTLYINASKLTGQQALVEVFNSSGQRLLAQTLILNDLTTLKLDFKGFVVVKLTSGEKVIIEKGILMK